MMKFRIHSCGVSDCPPSWHWHTAPCGFPDYDLWAVFRGHGFVTPQVGENISVRVHEGAALLLAPNTQYKAEHDPNDPILTINVHFDCLDDDGNVIYPRAFCAKHIADVSFMRSLLMYTVNFFNSNRKEEAHSFLSAALTLLDVAECLHDSDSDNIWAHIIYEISAEIDSAKTVPTLAEFAARYSYSERYIGKMFAKIQGISFSDYIRNSRISKAKTLLRHTDAPMGVIAEETGFYDACHFSKAFRDAVGVSPLVYRKNQ